MNTLEYIASINVRYQRGNATEHTYRGDLGQLLESLAADINVTNEPQRQACGAPDYAISRKDIPLGFIEAKNINDDGTITDLDFLAATFKKYSAIHQVPYAWVLKMGSVWYRYKTYKSTGVDFIETAWDNFNYKVNFDPVTSSDTKTYKFLFDGEKNITLQNTSNNESKIQTGFYPKVINDFNVFYNGYDLYSGYTDSEIQTSVNGGMKVYNFTDSNINPINLELGHIAKDLKVGDKNIDKDSNSNIFLSILENFNTKHL